jgi:hypothetical protein
MHRFARTLLRFVTQILIQSVILHYSIQYELHVFLSTPVFTASPLKWILLML